MFCWGGSGLAVVRAGCREQVKGHYWWRRSNDGMEKWRWMKSVWNCVAHTFICWDSRGRLRVCVLFCVYETSQGMCPFSCCFSVCWLTDRVVLMTPFRPSAPLTWDPYWLLVFLYIGLNVWVVIVVVCAHLHPLNNREVCLCLSRAHAHRSGDSLMFPGTIEAVVALRHHYSHMLYII